MNYASNEYGVSKQVKLRMATGVVSLFSCLLLGSGSALAVWSNDESVTKSHHFITNVSIDDRVHYNIPAQSLSKALVLFGKQAGVEISSDPTTLDGLSTKAIKGKFTQSQVIKQLLKNTGLKYSRLDKKTLIVSYPNLVYAQSGDIALDTITVEGEEKKKATGEVQDPTSHLDGYIATSSRSGLKTNTPIEKIPQSISVITSDRIDDQKAKSVSEAIGYSAGVVTKGFGFDQRFDHFLIRGFDQQGTGIYRDGLQLRNMNFVSWSMEPFGLERLEVIKGPTSTLYGQNAPGGLVDGISKRPRDEEHGEIFAAFGSFKYKETGVDFGGPLSDGLFSYRFVGLWRDGETQVDEVDNKRIYLAPSITWSPSDKTSLTVLANFQRDDNGDSFRVLPGPSRATGEAPVVGNTNLARNTFLGDADKNRFLSEQGAIGYELEHKFSSDLTLRQKARFSASDLKYNTIYNGARVRGFPFPPVFVNQFDPNNTLLRLGFDVDEETQYATIDTNAEYKFKYGQSKITTLMGIDFTYIDDDASIITSTDSLLLIDSRTVIPVGPLLPTFPYSGSNTLISKEKRKQLGLYGQAQINFDDHWELTLGGRHDWVRGDLFSRTNTVLASGTTNEIVDRKTEENEFTGRAALSYSFDNGLTSYVSYTESFNPVNGVSVSGTPFDPETGVQYEAGLKYKPKGTNHLLTMAIFDLTRQNVASQDRVNPGIRRQIGEVTSRGLELEGNFDFDFGLQLQAAYSYLDAEITDGNASEIGNLPARVPEHAASLWANYEFQNPTLKGFSISAGVRYIGERFGDDLNGIKLEDVTLVDAAIRYEWKNWNFALNASNLFDKDYIAGCSAYQLQDFTQGTTNYGCTYGEARRILFTTSYKW